MNDFANLEKTIVRELSCRLCLCSDVVKLKPLNAELKRKLKKLFNVTVRTDDNLPKAICHDCLQSVSNMHLYSVKVEKTQKFLDFHKSKTIDLKPEMSSKGQEVNPVLSNGNEGEPEKKLTLKSPQPEMHQGDSNKLTPLSKQKVPKRKSPSEMKHMEAMSLEEFAKQEQVDKALLNSIPANNTEIRPYSIKKVSKAELLNESLDPIVLIDGRPAKQGTELDKQITLFYKMECCICHEAGFHFRSLMKHYKDRHGVPGYVTCCDKKFHYFYPKKIIEHMAYHLQPNIFMCKSCHQNFRTSQELQEHEGNGGRSEGKILCPRCSDRFPTYHELGWHLVTHRTDKMQCDYCGKQLKHHHRKKTINHMEDVILCSQCIRQLKSLEKQEKELTDCSSILRRPFSSCREKVKAKSNDAITLQKHQKFRQAMGLSGDEEASSDEE